MHQGDSFHVVTLTVGRGRVGPVLRRGVLRSAAHARVLPLALALCLGGAALAGDLEVNPVRVDLSPREKSAVVVLRNRSADPARYEVKVFAWDQTAAGEMKLSPTEAVTASPSIVQLAPGEKRDLRVGTTGPFGPIEKAYRLSIEELPQSPRPGEPAQVRVSSRIGIPVFLAPQKADGKASLEDLAIGAGKVRFALRAAGTVHVRPSAVKVTGLGPDGAIVFEKSGDNWYVLAGEARRYELTIPEDACAGTRSVRVDVTLAAGPLHAEIAVPHGACGH